jgi:hypothetical protein
MIELSEEKKMWEIMWKIPVGKVKVQRVSHSLIGSKSSVVADRAFEAIQEANEAASKDQRRVRKLQRCLEFLPAGLETGSFSTLTATPHPPNMTNLGYVSQGGDVTVHLHSSRTLLAND